MLEVSNMELSCRPAQFIHLHVYNTKSVVTNDLLAVNSNDLLAMPLHF
jgi:hypothetical protein